jgi:hypothetical protein
MMLMPAPNEPHAPSRPPERGRSASEASRVVAAPRFLGTLILAQVFLSFALAAFADPLGDRAVALFKEVCVAPVTPEGLIEAGNKAAAAEGWKLLMAAPTPLPFMHNENGPKISFTSMWDLALWEASRATLVVSIIRPELPGVKYSICFVQPNVDVLRGSLAQSVEQQFGSIIVKDTSGRFRDSQIWFISEEKARGNCGRTITIMHDESNSINNPRTLMFMDLAAPNDGNWNALLTQSACRS